MAEAIKREIGAGGRVTLSDGRCTFTYERLRAGVLEIRISGTDGGQFGSATLDEISNALRRERPL